MFRGWSRSILFAGTLLGTAGSAAHPPPGAALPDDRASPAGAPAAPGGANAPQVLLFNHDLDFAIPFERTFDFAGLPFSGQFRDATQDGIRVRATGLRHWVHLDGSPLGGRVARQPDAREEWTIDLPDGSHLFEFQLWESAIPGVGASTCFNFDFCTDTLYRIRVFGAGTLLREIDFSPYDDQRNTVALWSSVPITQIVMVAEVNNVDDEFLGRLRVGASPLPAGLQFVPAPVPGGFGTHAAVSAGRAVVGRAGGFELRRKNAQGAWIPAGQREVAGTLQRITFDETRAALAASTPTGSRLEIYDASGDDASAWPATTFEYPAATRAIEVDDDLVAVGIDGQVLVYRLDPVDGWSFESTLTANPPIPGSDEFGRSIGLDGGRLVVNAGRGLFHVFERIAGGPFQETFRQEQAFTTRSQLDLSGSTIVVQSFEGALRIFEPDGAGGWFASQFPVAPPPAGIGLALGAGVRIDGDRLLALQTFQTPPSVEVRGIASVWQRDAFGRFARTALFVEPHRAGSAATQLGSSGRALSLDGDDLVLGLPFTPWCDLTGLRAFFGDSGTQDYDDVCEGRSGAVYLARASALGDGVFSADFES